MRGLECACDSERVRTVYFYHVPVPGAVFCGCVLVGNFIHHCGELHLVGVIEHYEVVQSERACYAACALRNLLLYSSVRNEGIRLVFHRFAESGGEETFCYGGTHGHGMSLSERAGSVFYSAFGIEFRMSGCNASPLTELLEFLYCEFSCEGEYTVEHR